MLAPRIEKYLHLELAYYPYHLSSRRDDIRLSCLLTQALMPLESIANLNDATYVVMITLHCLLLMGWEPYI